VSQVEPAGDASAAAQLRQAANADAADASRVPERDAAAAAPEPELGDNELRCTLCGLRACWTG
jgi:hypothetical protein